MDKILTIAFCALYIAIFVSVLINTHQDDWMPHTVVGIISCAIGALATYSFFSSNKKNIHDFLKKPSIKKAGNILLIRKKTLNKDKKDA